MRTAFLSVLLLTSAAIAADPVAIAPAPKPAGPRPVVLRQPGSIPDTITLTLTNFSAPMAGFTNGMTLQMTRRPRTNYWEPVGTGPVYACGQISTGFLNPADPIGSAVTKFSFTVRRIAPLGTYDAPGVIDIPGGGIPSSQRIQFMFSVPNASAPPGITFDAALR